MIKNFFDERKARHFELWMREKGYCINAYRIVYPFCFLYVVEYWK